LEQQPSTSGKPGFEIISPRQYVPQLSKKAGMLIDFKNHKGFGEKTCAQAVAQ
jgi:hypothetical protein